jgi:hypothetical protein
LSTVVKVVKVSLAYASVGYLVASPVHDSSEQAAALFFVAVLFFARVSTRSISVDFLHFVQIWLLPFQHGILLPLDLVKRDSLLVIPKVAVTVLLVVIQ